MVDVVGFAFSFYNPHWDCRVSETGLIEVKHEFFTVLGVDGHIGLALPLGYFTIEVVLGSAGQPIHKAAPVATSDKR